MNRYQVQTGSYRAQQVAESLERAVVAAFKRRAPAEPALLTRAKRLSQGIGRGVWYYIATDVMLRRAGYPVHLERAEVNGIQK